MPVITKIALTSIAIIIVSLIVAWWDSDSFTHGGGTLTSIAAGVILLCMVVLVFCGVAALWSL